MQINHEKYMKKVKTMSAGSLRYVIKDCLDALRANPDGEKSGYYADEINYCSMELKNR